MMLAAVSLIAATAATAQEKVKAAIEELITAEGVAVNHTVSVRQQDEADPSKLIGLCEVYNFQLTEKQKPLLDKLEEAFEKDKQDENVKVTAGKFSWKGEIKHEYDTAESDKIPFKIPFGKGDDNLVYLNGPSYPRAKYNLLANSDRVEDGKDYHYTYALRWSDMNWEGKDEFPYRYVGKIVITYGTEYPFQVLAEIVKKPIEKAQQERRAKLMPALISSKIAALQKKDSVLREEAIELYQYFKTFRDASEEPVDPDDLGICMNEMTQLVNRKNIADDAIPYVLGAANILPKLKSVNEQRIANNKRDKEKFAANFAKYLEDVRTPKGLEAAGSLFDLVKKAVEKDWIDPDEREAFAVEIEIFLGSIDDGQGCSLLKGAIKKLRGK